MPGKITPRTKLIVPVHMAGVPCDMQAIMAIAKKHGIPVLEDCAQANGGSFNGQKLGTFGTLGIFSLQWNKNATAGEGGLIVTNDAQLYERCNAAHDLGIPWVGSAAEPGGGGPVGRRAADERVDGGGRRAATQEAAGDRAAHAGLQAAHQGRAGRRARSPLPAAQRRSGRRRPLPDHGLGR